jgi:hypothetical protein
MCFQLSAAPPQAADRIWCKCTHSLVPENHFKFPPYHGDCIFPDAFVFQLWRILFFTSANVPVLTDRARKIIAEQVDSPNSIVAACASAAVSQAQDHALNALALEQGLRFNKACLRISIPFP